MNYIEVGCYDKKILHLIECKYINNQIALLLLNNNIEYAEITIFNNKIKLKTGYFFVY